MDKRGKKILMIVIIILLVSLVLVLAGLMITGASIGWGPFKNFYNWQKEVDKVKELNPLEDNQNQIVFYGASNFRLWSTMKEDFSEYKVQNHGFGGSTDKLLMKYADQILYPYNPKIVVFQTGSNDYVGLTGSVEEKVKEVMKNKILMFETFHENLPKANFIVLSGILMPKRASFTPIVKLVNKELEKYCATKDYLYYVDSEGLTYNEGEYIEEYFVEDGIHLTNDARRIWAERYIKPMIEKLVK